MEHSTIHPAKTVGDLRAYAQKFKQNQFCFKFLLDEIAATIRLLTKMAAFQFLGVLQG